MKTGNCKIKILIILTVLFMVFSMSACDNSEKHTYALPEVKVGDTFEIALESNASTGFSWSYSISSKSGIEFVDEKYVPHNDDPHIIGGGGIKTYTFKVTKKGRFKIKFKYQQSWEKGPIKTNIYKIKAVK